MSGTVQSEKSDSVPHTRTEYHSPSSPRNPYLGIAMRASSPATKRARLLSEPSSEPSSELVPSLTSQPRDFLPQPLPHHSHVPSPGVNSHQLLHPVTHPAYRPAMTTARQLLPQYLPPREGRDPHSVYLYNSWMATTAAAMAAGGKAHSLHAAWTQALREGKVSSAFMMGAVRPGTSRSTAPMAYPRGFQDTGAFLPSDEARAGPHYDRGSTHLPQLTTVGSATYHRRLSGVSPTSNVRSGSSVKSSPSPIESPQVLVHEQRTAHEGSPKEQNQCLGNATGGTFQSSTGSSSKGSSTPSLADDIRSMRSELEGASSAVKERALKILDRLMARLVLAETERDNAFAELSDLRQRFRQANEALQRQRSELRELLHREEAAGCKTISAPAISQIQTNLAIGLPKVDLKSPARVLEERERQSRGSSSGSSVTRSPPLPLARANSRDTTSHACDDPTQLQASRRGQDVHHDSGTERSTKSTDSDDLPDRMMRFEAELQALKEALSHTAMSSSSAASTPTSKQQQDNE